MARKEKKPIAGIILGSFIAFIMIGSVFGIMFSGYNQNSASLKYNGLKFVRANNWVTTNINNKRIYFSYFPTEVEQIELSEDIKQILLNKPEIDVTSSVNDTFSEEIALAHYNLALALNELNIYTRQGFTQNNTYNIPIMTCKDSTAAVPIIFFKKSNQTKITMQDTCIIAEARNSVDILLLKDRLLYSILGIIR